MWDGSQSLILNMFNIRNLSKEELSKQLDLQVQIQRRGHGCINKIGSTERQLIIKAINKLYVRSKCKQRKAKILTLMYFRIKGWCYG